MSTETVLAIRDNLKASRLLQDQILISWHSGEPLVHSPTFFEFAFEAFSPENFDNIEIKQTLQTNGMLISDQFCELFKRHHVHIGISIDGPQQIHDRHRRDRKQKGTWHQVMSGLKKLQKHNIPFSVITVLTAEALNHPDELYQFYIDHGIHTVGFNIDELEGAHTNSSYSDEKIKEKYCDFFRRLISLCRKDKILNVREFSFLMQMSRLDGELPFNNQTEPLATINISAEGDFSTYSPELLDAKHEQFGNFILGNVHGQPIVNCLNNAKFLTLSEEISRGVAACEQSCAYYSICKGGAPSNKYFENGSFDSTQTLYCYFRTQLLTDIFFEELLPSQADFEHAQNA